MTLDDISLPDVTHRPTQEVRALQDRLLRRTIELCYEAHPFYARLMRREGIKPQDIQTCDDLVRLPPTGKQDFLEEPEAFRLDPARLDPEFGTLASMIYTSGTTSGRPAPLAVTTFDRAAFMYDVSRRKDLLKVGPGDVIANLFPLTPFPMGAYSRAGDEAAALGAAIVTAHPGRQEGPFPLRRGLDEVIDLIVSARATVLWGVAGFVRRVLVRAGEISADVTQLRICMITGEASSQAMRDDMSRRMRALGCAGDRIVNRYGSTELGSSLMECAPGSGFHDLAPDQIFHEVIDEETGRRLDDGETGALAFTHLIRRGTMFLRYKIGDVGALSRETCPHCGRTSPRVISNPVRTGDIVKIKGMMVNLQALKDLLEQIPTINEYQIVIQAQTPGDAFSPDELLLRLALAPGNTDADATEIAAQASNLVKVTPRLELTEKDAIFDPMVAAKPRRVFDRRSILT